MNLVVTLPNLLRNRLNSQNLFTWPTKLISWWTFYYCCLNLHLKLFFLSWSYRWEKKILYKPFPNYKSSSGVININSKCMYSIIGFKVILLIICIRDHWIIGYHKFYSIETLRQFVGLIHAYVINKFLLSKKFFFQKKRKSPPGS